MICDHATEPNDPNATQPVPALDLDAVASSIGSNYPALGKAIEHFQDAHSAHTDLTTSYEMLLSVSDAAKAADAGFAWAQSAVPALIYSAVILYSRATKTSSRHRKTFDIIRPIHG